MVADYLQSLNESELLEVARLQRGLRLRRGLPAERIIHLLDSGEHPAPEEFNDTVLTRAKLEEWLRKRWDAINTQLPCKGYLKGHCTVYPCPDARHLDCWLAVEGKMI